MRLIHIASILLICSISSCSKKKITPYDVFERNENETAKRNSVLKRIEIKVDLDTVGNPLWKKIVKISIYNKDGLLTMEIFPHYVTHKTSFIPPANEKDPLGWLFNNSKMSQTNIPTGGSDTSIYKYDDIGNLILLRERGQAIYNYKYDINNNLTERCYQGSKYSEILCKHSVYKYDEKNKIVFKIDSSDVMSSREGRKFPSLTRMLPYKYDEKGRIVFDGEFQRKFNNKNQLIEVSVYNENNTPDQSLLFSYDRNENRISETRITKVNNQRFDTTRTFFYYDKNRLLIQKKTLNIEYKLRELSNYEYTFY